jgi:HAD superfamily hydrolase (TIGR01509 family)
MPRAILFDLDDTLFDHSLCSREALASVHRIHACFSAIPFDDFACAHAAHLEELHLQVLAGTIELDAARQERFLRLLVSVGGDPALAAHAASVYRDAYKAARRAVDGAAELLALLRTQAPIVIVSNNLLAEQREKMEECGLAPHIDALVVSEEAGVAKPDPEIFTIALRTVGVGPSDAVMVGDSWAADIAGAHAAGIIPVWFNPQGLPAPTSPDDIVELRALAPAQEAVETIFSAYTGRAHRG